MRGFKFPIRNRENIFFIVSDKPPEQERTVFLKQSARGENARRKYQAQRAVRGAAEYEVFIGKFFGF